MKLYGICRNLEYCACGLCSEADMKAQVQVRVRRKRKVRERTTDQTYPSAQTARDEYRGFEPPTNELAKLEMAERFKRLVGDTTRKRIPRA